MNIKYIWLLIVFIQMFSCMGCTKNAEEKNPAPEFKLSIPENDATNVSLSTKIEVTFNGVISLASNHGITINNAPAVVKASSNSLVFESALTYNTSYKIIIPKGTVFNSFGVPLTEEIQIVFKTKEAPLTNESLEFVKNMGVGWNLGNTLDTKSVDETAWGNPKARKELIDAISAKGFKTLRVPVTWQYHMGAAPDYTIEASWLDRVVEVVNYGLDNGMYVIINIHHDEEWLTPNYAKADKVKDQLGKVWSQIAERFKEYDNHLIFETLNETRLKDSPEEWTGGTAEGRDCINQYHQVAVDAIRSTGSNNTNRYIMVSTYAASAAQVAIDGLILPTAENILLSIHNYYPYELCLGKNGKDWGTDADKQSLDAEFDKLVNKFISKGIPVVMGEWGNLNHDNPEDRIRHAGYYAEGCLKRGICPIWWDNGNSKEFGIINRYNFQWVFPEIADAIVNASKQ